MSETKAADASMSTTDTLTQMIEVLGFHDWASFLWASIFALAALSFVIAGIVVIVKKRKERLLDLEKIVAEIQQEESKPDVPESALPGEKVAVERAREAKKIVDGVAEAKPAVSVVEKTHAKVVAHEKQSSEPVKSVTIEPPAKIVEEKVASKVSAKEPPAKIIEEKVASKVSAKEPPAKIVAERVASKVPAKEPLAKTVEEKVTSKVAAIEPPAIIVEEKVDNKAALGAALKNTRGGFMQKLARLFSSSKEVSDADFEEMEAILFTADIGVKTAQKLLDVMRERARSEHAVTKDGLRNILKEEMTKILGSVATKTDAGDGESSPQVLMFVGVNGAGKTTSIGKLGAQLVMSGKKVLFGAGDTFRAAAVEQLSVWGQRVGAEVVKGKENSDPASVLFDAIEKAKLSHADYVLCDTAGRLHTKTSLMDELKKVHRVVSKAQSGAPHQVFLVIDATMGQNALNQAREFAAATPLTGVVLSKLDGTAKGGVALGIVDELKVPIRYIGIGEKVTDLKDFDAQLFVDALFEEA